jgi:hypothetical protein
MVSAGIYGFADMAHDVKTGTMIQYDRGEDDPVAESALADVHLIAHKKIEKFVQIEKKFAPEKTTQKTVVTKKKEKIPVVDVPVVADSVITQPVIAVTTEVKADSVPQLDLPREEEKLYYSDFSRGSPRKYKKKKH